MTTKHSVGNDTLLSARRSIARQRSRQLFCRKALLVATLLE